MKIGIDISQLVYKGTGVARYVEHLVSKLVEIDDKNEYILFGNSLRKKNILDVYYNKNLKINPRVNKKIIPLPQTFMEILWNKLHIIPIENFIGKVDLFHTSDWVEPPAKAKKVTTIHDFLVFKYPELFPQDLVETQKRRVSWVINEAEIILVDSESTKKDGYELLSVPKEKMVVVYPGISANFKPASNAEIKRINSKYRISKPYLLSVGTREPRKNVDRIIAAFKTFEKKLDMELIIVGNLGWGYERNPNDERIKLLGFVPDEDLPVLYSGASCFIYPSLYEGFGFPVLEALACGTKVVTARGGSLAEVGNSYCTYVDPENTESIAEGIKKALVVKTPEGAVSWAHSFKWERTAKEVLDIYQKIVK